MTKVPEPSCTVVQDITATRLPPTIVALWWLGQASIVIRDAHTTIFIDPFLSEHPLRLVAPPFSPEAAPPADYVLYTHEHIDHLDPKTLLGLAQATLQARFVVPFPLVERVIALGVASERVLGAQAFMSFLWDNVKIFPVPALHGLTTPPAHYDFGLVEQEGRYVHRYLGYVIEIAGIRIYHAGDTLIYDGMLEHLRDMHIDIALLPINGRNYFREQRGLVGNMDEYEAADLAAAIGVKILIPLHYDMFAANRGRPGVLVDYIRETHPQLTCVVLAHGQRFTYFKNEILNDDKQEYRMNRQEGSSACPFCEDIKRGRVDPNTQVWLHPNDFPPFEPPE